jgi:hypothetical protein
VEWCRLDSSGSGQGPVIGSCVHSNGPSSSIKVGEFPDQLSDCQLLKDPGVTLIYRYIDSYPMGNRGLFPWG